MDKSPFLRVYPTLRAQSVGFSAISQREPNCLGTESSMHAEKFRLPGLRQYARKNFSFKKGLRLPENVSVWQNLAGNLRYIGIGKNLKSHYSEYEKHRRNADSGRIEKEHRVTEAIDNYAGKSANKFTE